MDIFSKRSLIDSPYFSALAQDSHRQGFIFIDPAENVRFSGLGVIDVAVISTSPWVSSSGMLQSPFPKVWFFSRENILRGLNQQYATSHQMDSSIPSVVFPSEIYSYIPYILGHCTEIPASFIFHGKGEVSGLKPDILSTNGASIDVIWSPLEVQRSLGFAFSAGFDVYETENVLALEEDEIAFVPVSTGRMLNISEGIAEGFMENVPDAFSESILEGVSVDIFRDDPVSFGVLNSDLDGADAWLVVFDWSAAPVSHLVFIGVSLVDYGMSQEVGVRIEDNFVPFSSTKSPCCSVVDADVFVFDGVPEFCASEVVDVGVGVDVHGVSTRHDIRTAVYFGGRPVAGLRVLSLFTPARKVRSVEGLVAIADYDTGVVVGDVVEFDLFDSMDKLSLSALGVEPRFVDAEDSVLGSSNGVDSGASTSGLSLEGIASGFVGAVV